MDAVEVLSMQALCTHAQVEELLSPSALSAFADVRRRLVDSVGVLWMDFHELKLTMRTAASKAFVHSMAAVAEHVRR